MKIETIKRFLDKTNWKFNEEDYTKLCGLSGDLVEVGVSFTISYERKP